MRSVVPVPPCLTFSIGVGPGQRLTVIFHNDIYEVKLLMLHNVTCFSVTGTGVRNFKVKTKGLSVDSSSDYLCDLCLLLLVKRPWFSGVDWCPFC
jgi:hypothetical protein